MFGKHGLAHFQKMFSFPIWSCDGSEIHHWEISITLFLFWLAKQPYDRPQAKLIKLEFQTGKIKLDLRKIKLYPVQGSKFISINCLHIKCDHSGNWDLLIYTNIKQMQNVKCITCL